MGNTATVVTVARLHFVEKCQGGFRGVWSPLISVRRWAQGFHDCNLDAVRKVLYSFEQSGRRIRRKPIDEDEGCVSEVGK